MHIQQPPSEIIVMLWMTKYPGIMKPPQTLCPNASPCLFHFLWLGDNDLSAAGGHVRDLPSHFLLACQIESSHRHNPQKFRRVCEWEGRLGVFFCFVFSFFCVWLSNIMTNCGFDSCFGANLKSCDAASLAGGLRALCQLSRRMRGRLASQKDDMNESICQTRSLPTGSHFCYCGFKNKS